MATTIGRPATYKNLGVDFNATTTTPTNELGLRLRDVTGRMLMYIKAGGTLTVDCPVEVDSAFVGTTGASVRIDGVAPMAFATNDYGWIVIQGDVTIDAATDLDAGNFFLWLAASSRATEVAAATDARRGYSLATEAANKVLVRLI
jgi:hypothetical protein